MSFVVSVLALGWGIGSLSFRPAGPIVSYHVDLCATLSLRNDLVGRSSCREVHARVRRGFDAWQINAPVQFQETASPSAMLTVNTAWLAPGTLGRATADSIQLDRGACWYMDRGLCHSLSVEGATIGIAIGWALSILLALLFVAQWPPWPYLGAVRVVVWTAVIALPLLYWTSVRPCFECHDLEATIAHEVGHLLGIGHADSATVTYCGCGATRRPGPCNESSTAIMHSVALHRPSMCLMRDDVDAARTLLGGTCDDPVWCYEHSLYGGLAQSLVAVCYGVLGALVVVFVRNRVAAILRDHELRA